MSKLDKSILSRYPNTGIKVFCNNDPFKLIYIASISFTTHDFKQVLLRYDSMLKYSEIEAVSTLTDYLINEKEVRDSLNKYYYAQKRS